MNSVLLFLHILGVVFWAGGVFVNTLVLMPSMGAISPPERGKLMGAFVKRFGPLAWGALAIVGISGLILTNGLIGLSGLFSFDSSYSNILLTKIVLVIVMVLNGLYISFVLGPKVAAPRPPAGGPRPAGSGEGAGPPGPPPELVRVQSRMTTVSWVQVVLAVIVIFLAAL